MREPPETWAERGLAYVRLYLELYFPAEHCGANDPPVVAVLPCALALARRWGSLDPARACGFLATLHPAFFRGTLRAAVVEQADWPPAMVRPALRRAEADALSLLSLQTTEPERMLELWDVIAMAWARHEPSELTALHARLHANVAPQGSGLWLDRIRRQAAESTAEPPPGMFPAGDQAKWRRIAEWSPSPVTRARACLALSATS